MQNQSTFEFWTHKFNQQWPFSKTLLTFWNTVPEIVSLQFFCFFFWSSNFQNFLKFKIFKIFWSSKFSKFFGKVGNTDTKSAPFFIEKKALIISMPILNNIKDVLCQATRLYKRVVQRHSLQHHHHEHQQLGASHQGGGKRGWGGVWFEPTLPLTFWNLAVSKSKLKKWKTLILGKFGGYNFQICWILNTKKVPILDFCQFWKSEIFHFAHFH